jgi:hypothetical protein
MKKTKKKKGMKKNKCKIRGIYNIGNYFIYIFLYFLMLILIMSINYIFIINIYLPLNLFK